MPHLFSPLTIKSIELKNRIVVSPMCQYSAEEGFPNAWHTVHYGARAGGGAALVMVEATAVSAPGRITAADLGLWSDRHTPVYTFLAGLIAERGAVPGIQLAHAGRKGSHHVPWKGGTQIPSGEEGGWKTVSASPVPWGNDAEAPEALDSDGIKQVKAEFRAAAERACAAGFKVLELHFAHGYMIHQFISPLSNFRTDEYGGSFENRIRLPLEILDMVKEVWPAALPLFVRISATEWVKDGWNEQDSVALASILKDRGVDMIDCSSGGNIAGVKIPLTPGYQVPLATAVRGTGILSGAVGLISTPRQANDIIVNGQADLVLMAREFLRDPNFPLRAAHELGVDIKWPVQYERAKWPG